MTFTTHSVRVVNTSDAERVASILGGGALMAYGLVRRGRGALLLAALGGGLVARGVSGYCPICHALGLHRNHRNLGRATSVPYELGIRVDRTLRINRTPEELYSFWRKLDNLPRFMKSIESIHLLDNKRSRWVAQAIGGRRFEWDAEIIHDEPNRQIGWRSLPGADVDSGGSVQFKKLPGDRGTEVTVELQYNPPGGFVGAGVAKLLWMDPEKQIDEDLRRFKTLMEAGEVPGGQPRGYAARQPSGKRESWEKETPWREKDVVQEASEESFPASDAPSWTPST